MKLGLDTKQLTGLLKRGRGIFARYHTEILSLLVLILLSLAVLRVAAQTDPPLDQERYDQQLQSLKRVNFDEEAIEAINELRDSNVDVKPSLPGNRRNPFAE